MSDVIHSTGHACTCEWDEDACPLHPGDPCPVCGRRSGHDDDCTNHAGHA